MPKGTRGGKRQSVTGGGSASFVFQPGQMATPQQAQQILDDLDNGESITLNNFLALSDDDKADAIKTIKKQGIPNHLDNSMTQKLMYYTEIDQKPNLVSDTALSKMPGKSIYRTVNQFYNRSTDVGYSAKQIYNQIAKGDFTQVSSSGGSAYGKGIYFADSYTGSTSYGNYRGTNKTLTMRAKLNNNAKVASYSTITRGLRNEIRSGSKLGKQLSKMSGSDAESVYALCKGYNVIDGGSYKVVLDRGVLNLSQKTTNGSGTKWQ